MSDCNCTVWKLRKFTLTLIWQKFRESNIFTKELTQHIVENSKFYCHIFLQRFREIDSFTKEFYSKMIWRKIICVAVNLSFFHCVHKLRNDSTKYFFCETTGQCSTLWKNEKITLTQEIFRQINYLVILFVKPLFWRNFCQKSVRVKFRKFMYSHAFLAKISWK